MKIITQSRNVARKLVEGLIKSERKLALTAVSLAAVALALILSLASPALAGGSSGGTSELKSGSSITPLPADPRTMPQIETYYAKMHYWEEVRQQCDAREPVNWKGPSIDGEGKSGGSSASGSVSTASAGSSGSSSGTGGDRWTRQKRKPPPWPYPLLQKIEAGPAYHQPQVTIDYQAPTYADLDVVQQMPDLPLLPLTHRGMSLIDEINQARFVDKLFAPTKWLHTVPALGEMAGFSANNAVAQGAEEGYGDAMNAIMQGSANSGGIGGGSGALINIANEASGVPAGGNPQTIPQAVWMVQQMYAGVFVPMAILFLLPGAVITQVKGQVAASFNLKADDSSSPFEGILRSIVAIFLIPSTQLIVSYSIDVGNSMAFEVSKWVDLPTILDWAHRLSYNSHGYDNMIVPPQMASVSGGSGGSSTASAAGNVFDMVASGSWGALTSSALGSLGGSTGSGGNSTPGAGADAGTGLQPNDEEAKSINERQTWDSSFLQDMFNGAIDLFSLALMVLTAFQLVYMCYLYLMGPISAAFFAWPTVQGRLFRTVFGNWVNAVIMLALWRFYWMVIMAIMTVRLAYIAERGGQTDLQWEVAVFTCLVGLMFYIPMNPWNFDPAQAYQTATQLGSQMMGAAGGGGASGGEGAEAANVDGGLASAAHEMPDVADRAPTAAPNYSPPEEVAEMPPPTGPDSDTDTSTYVAYDAGNDVIDTGNNIDNDAITEAISDAPPTAQLAFLEGTDGNFDIPGGQFGSFEAGQPSLMPEGGEVEKLAFESNPNVKEQDVDQGREDVSSVLNSSTTLAYEYEPSPPPQGESDSSVPENTNPRHSSTDEIHV